MKNNSQHLLHKIFLERMAWWVVVTNMDMIINTSEIVNSGQKQTVTELSAYSIQEAMKTLLCVTVTLDRRKDKLPNSYTNPKYLFKIRNMIS